MKRRIRVDYSRIGLVLCILHVLLESVVASSA
jgi:hypothetical protein